jgi:hypothetical protein
MRSPAARGLSSFAIVAVVGLCGCASSSGSATDQVTSPDSSSSNLSPTTATQRPVSIRIRFRDGQLVAPATLVTAAVGQPIDLVVTSDSDQEIHVHSTPEHEYEVRAGARDEMFEFTIDTPGTIEVESHTLDALIVKIQVS